jgi:uncharacterized protein
MFILNLIRFYQKRLSKPLHLFFIIGGCRFTPTCSEYAYRAVVKYGTIKGLFLGLKRILRCNPFSKGGNDPVR